MKLIMRKGKQRKEFTALTLLRVLLNQTEKTALQRLAAKSSPVWSINWKGKY